MRSIVRAAAAAAFAAVLVTSARAAPFTGHFEDLRTYMQAKFDGIPDNSPLDDLERRTACAKGLAALEAKSTTLVGDVRILGKVAAAIDIPLLTAESGSLLQDA